MSTTFCGKHITTEMKSTDRLFKLFTRTEFNPVVCQRSYGHRGECSSVPQKATVWKGKIVRVSPIFTPRHLLRSIRQLDAVSQQIEHNNINKGTHARP